MRYFVVRFLANGNPDPGFTPLIGESTDGEAYFYFSWSSYPVSALVVQPDGKIIVSGHSASVNDTNRTGVVRLNGNGTRDTTFNPGIGTYAWVASLASQTDGKLLMAGSFGIVNGTYRTGILRLAANGGFDNTFNAATGPTASVSAFALQPDGKVIIGGSFTNVNGTNSSAVARLNSNGSFDNSFNPATASGVGSLALQPDGNVLIGGAFFTVSGTERYRVARLYGDSSAPSLSIARWNASMILTWPVSALNFQLQENTNLALPNSWSPVEQSGVTNGAQISVSVPASAPRKFFRLKSQ